ncbi:hypothetical protein EH220_03040 [bacterium]|nr:MAG: hypothetical protein EH220_03040 [bacterium]
MAFGALYSNGALVIHTTSEGAAVEIGNITNLSMPQGMELSAPQSGTLYDYFRSIISEVPMVNVTTESIAQILDTIGAAAKCIVADGTHPGVVLYGEKHDECDGRASGAVHNSYTIKKGLIVPMTLDATHGQNATISMDIHAVTDGTNDPLIPAYTATLPSSVVRDEIFGIGVCKVAGQQLDNVQSVSINFGISVLKKSGSGSTSPLWASPAKIKPVITITTTDPTIVDDAKLSLDGTVATHLNTVIQLRKRLCYGKYVADATAEHIAITAAGLVVIEQPHSASGESEASVTFRIEGVHDGTDVPLVIDTTSAYDATP